MIEKMNKVIYRFFENIDSIEKCVVGLMEERGEYRISIRKERRYFCGCCRYIKVGVEIIF